MKVALIALLGLIVSPLAGDQTKNTPEPGSVPVFKSGTVYVQVPVIVHRDGKHVTGLKSDNFIVRQDGKPQPIASLEEVHRSAKPGAREAQADPGQVVANPLPAQTTIVALDLVNTPNLERAYFNDQIRRYLTSARRFPGPIGLIAIESGGIRMLHEFTTDPAAILASLREVSNKAKTANNDVSPLARARQNEAAKQLENDEMDAESYLQALRDLKFSSGEESATRFQDRSARINMQMSIQQLAQALKGIPGRKTLLLVGSGFKFIDTKIVLNVIGGGRGGISIDRNIENGNETLDQAAYTWKLLNDANVAVYPIDTRRTVNPAFDNMDPSNAGSPSRLASEQSRQADMDTLESFRMMAAQTGGKPCIYRTDLDNCVREAVEDDHDYYLLGFYADRDNRKPGWHSIEVKLKDRKGNVRHRQGFMLATFNPEQQRRTDISLALQSPFAYTDLHIRARFDEAREGKDGKKLVPFHIMVPPGGIVPEDEHGRVNFDIVAIARAEGGKQAGDFNQHVDRPFPAQALQEIRTTGVDYKNSFELPAGEYAVWFVVRDNISGRTGSSVVRLKVP